MKAHSRGLFFCGGVFGMWCLRNGCVLEFGGMVEALARGGND